jgi:hypothetical protein
MNYYIAYCISRFKMSQKTEKNCYIEPFCIKLNCPNLWGRKGKMLLTTFATVLLIIRFLFRHSWRVQESHTLNLNLNILWSIIHYTNIV